MEGKDSEKSQDLTDKQNEETPVQEEPAAEDAKHEEGAHKGEHHKKEKTTYVFKECPETSAFTDEEVKTENCKTLDEISTQKMKYPIYSYGKRIRINTFSTEEGKKFVDTEVKVCGWAKTMRQAQKGKLYFVDLNDGSSISSLQVVIDDTIEGFERLSNEGVGTSFEFVGTLVKSPAKGQMYELKIGDNSKHSMKIFGSCPQGDYPLAKKKHTKEYLREKMHLRPRTNLISIVARLRNALSFATHEFFQKRGFLYVHTPIVTASDCEGAGEMFQVTTVLPDPKLPIENVPKTNDGKIDYSKDFFKKPAFLTVSGQLNVENYC